MLRPVVLVTRSLLAGYTNDNDCMYINGTGQDVYDFYIQVSAKSSQSKKRTKHLLMKRRKWRKD